MRHPGATSFLKRHELVVGIALMFLLTWPGMAAASGVLPFTLPAPLPLFLGWGLSVAAIVITGVSRGVSGITSLLRRFLIWRVGWRWYAVALFLFPAIVSGAVWANASLSGTFPDFSTTAARTLFGPQASLPILVLPFLLTDAITNGEELAWRGYVLPRLQLRHRALVSSLMVGAIWAVWHLPTLLAPDNATPWPILLAKIVVESILYTWLYNSSRGSLLLVTLFHAAGNTAGVFLPVATTIGGVNTGTLAIQVAIEALIATAVVLTQGADHLSPTGPRQISPLGD